MIERIASKLKAKVVNFAEENINNNEIVESINQNFMH